MWGDVDTLTVENGDGKAATFPLPKKVESGLPRPDAATPQAVLLARRNLPRVPRFGETGF